MLRKDLVEGLIPEEEDEKDGTVRRYAGTRDEDDGVNVNVDVLRVFVVDDDVKPLGSRRRRD